MPVSMNSLCVEVVSQSGLVGPGGVSTGSQRRGQQGERPRWTQGRLGCPRATSHPSPGLGCKSGAKPRLQPHSRASSCPVRALPSLRMLPIRHPPGAGGTEASTCTPPRAHGLLREDGGNHVHQLEPERDPQGDGKGPAVTDQVTFQCLQAGWQQHVRWTVELVGRTGSRMARGASPNSLKLSPESVGWRLQHLPRHCCHH